MTGEWLATVAPSLHLQAHLTEELKSKEALREHLKRQIDGQSNSFLELERNAATVIRKAAHSSRGLMVIPHASNSIELLAHPANVLHYHLDPHKN